MVARRNLKPTLGDALARLKATVEQSNTRPHGVKVATPGEGVALADTNGATTVLEGDTLPETLAGVIAADVVAARLMLAGTLRSVHADGSTVELTGAGYKAWNSAGQLTVDLNGTANLLTGEFRTASDGQPGLYMTNNAGLGLAAPAVFFSMDGTRGPEQAAIYHQAATGDLFVRARTDATVAGTVHVRGNFRTTGNDFQMRSPDSVGWDQTTSAAANLNVNSDGYVKRSVSSRRYKKFISDWQLDPAIIPALQLRRWRDRHSGDRPEDLRWYYGAIAEEVYDLVPEAVPMIEDPEQPGSGVMVPDAIDYDRLALAVAVSGYKDLDARLKALEPTPTTQEPPLA